MASTAAPAIEGVSDGRDAPLAVLPEGFPGSRGPQSAEARVSLFLTRAAYFSIPPPSTGAFPF